MNAMEKLDKMFVAARRVSTPILIVNTPDQWATMDRLAKLVKDGGVLQHDCIHGLRVVNDDKESKQALVSLLGDMKPEQSINPVAVLDAAERKLPGGQVRMLENTVLFMINAHRHFSDLPTRMIQAVMNVRDEFKDPRRTLVLLTAGSYNAPRELEGDVIVLDEPLPNAEQIADIVNRQHENAKIDKPSKTVLAAAVDALTGLQPFKAEQVAAMSLRTSGIDIEAAWDAKRKAISATSGLSVWVGDETFDTIGGLANIKDFYRRYLKGPNAPAAIVFIDEIEKDTAGMKGDNTGVAQRQHKALLTFMQNKKARGIMHAGQPGTGKSALAKAIGREAGIPVIEMNLGDLLDSKVGSSEAMMADALKTIDEVSQGRALFIATCNDFSGLSPELRARFKNGTFYFDLPDGDEREAVWQLYLKKFSRKMTEKRPDDDGWVPREIEACCDQAHTLGLSLVEAAEYIVPQAVAMRGMVESRRAEADGKIISASYSGKYDRTRVLTSPATAKGSRRIEMPA